MANKVLFLLTCPLTPETTIETDERIKAVRDVIAMGGFTDSKGVPLTLESFEFHYLVAESCFTPTGVLSPSKWKKLYKIEDFDRVIKDFGAVIVVEPTFTRLLTKDIFYTAVKNKYSYKQVNFFPIYPCKDLVDPRIEEALMRVDAAYSTANSESISAPSTTEVRIIRDREVIDDMWLTVLNTGLCCFDVETNEIDAGKKEGRIRYFQQGFKITTLSISPACGISYVMSIEHKDFVWEREDFLYLLQVLRKIFKNKDVVKVAQNIKYDLNALSVYGITQYAGEFNDTMLMGHLLNENEEVSLERFTQLYLPTFHGYKIKNFNIGFEELAKYNAQDTDNTLRIFVHFECKLREDIRLYKIYRNLSLPAFWALHRAANHGALVDVEYINTSITECEALIKRKEEELLAHPMVLKYRYHKALREEEARLAKKKLELGFLGEERVAELIEKTEVNFGSPKQLSELLFDKNIGFGIVALEDDTKEQTTSTRHEILASIDNEFVTTLMQFRALEKTLGTFFKGIQEKAYNNKIHASFNLTGVKGGRISVSEPNLQQLTSRTSIKDEEVAEMIMRVKKFFIAPAGYSVMQGDFSQLELRLIAMFSQDAAMIKAYGEGMDLHCLCAAQINNMTYEDFMKKEETDPKWYKSQRSCGKGANFSLSYGCSADTYRIYCKATYGISITPKEAELHHRNYFKRFPAMLRWHENYREKAREFGYTRSFFGRKRTLLDIFSKNNSFRAKAERVSINAPVQSSGGELALFLISIMKQILPPDDYIFFNTVHDSVMLYVKKGKEDFIGNALKNITANLHDVFGYFDVNMKKWNVPLALDIETGDSWGTIKKG